jgi:hypothetical protein
VSAVVFFTITPLAIWWWRREIVNLVGDCIAEGIMRASAIEAGTATTTEIGVVHESAAPNGGDAQ